MSKFHGRSVLVTDNNVERALRKLKKKVQESNILNDLRDKEFFIKPTTRKKIAANAARNRWRKYLDSQRLPPKNF